MKREMTGVDQLDSERRTAERKGIYLPLKLMGRDKRGCIVSEATFTVNLSKSGAFFLSRSEFKPGEVLDIHLKPVRDGEDELHIHATVVRVVKSLHGFNGIAREGVAVSFDESLEIDALSSVVS